MLRSLINLIKSARVLILPKRIRRSRIVTTLYNYIRMNIGGHDEIYDFDFYQYHEEKVKPSADVIAYTIMEDLAPDTAIDVGCGSGALMEALRSGGCNVLGLERSKAALSYCERRNLKVIKFDLINDTLVDRQKFDLVISLEVAEHLVEKYADKFVDLLCSLGNQIVFSAATPGQGGTNHVNKQPHSYWIDKFRQREYSYDLELSLKWSENWKSTDRVESWYYNNIMIFRR